MLFTKHSKSTLVSQRVWLVSLRVWLVSLRVRSLIVVAGRNSNSRFIVGFNNDLVMTNGEKILVSKILLPKGGGHDGGEKVPTVICRVGYFRNLTTRNVVRDLINPVILSVLFTDIIPPV